MVYLPTTLAQELGFYREEGLDVELQDFAGGAKSLQALVGGSADVVSGFYDHTIQMAAEGRELVAFVTMLRFPGLVLVTSPQSAAAVTTIEDLKGRVAGVTTAGSSSQMLLTFMLQRHGVAADAVSVTAIGSAATAIAALEHGKVDAGMMADPAFTLVQSAIRPCACWPICARPPASRSLRHDDLSGVGALHAAAWIARNRDTVARLARAITRTLALDAHAHARRKSPTDAEGASRRRRCAVCRGAEAFDADVLARRRDGRRRRRAGPDAARRRRWKRSATASIDCPKPITNEFVHGR